MEKEAKIKPYTNKDKWIVSITSGLLFMIISSPFLYTILNSATKLIGVTISRNGCPNLTGLVLHSVLFAVMVRFLMR